MRVAFAADHAGAAFKDELLARLDHAGLGHDYIDLGGDGSDREDDYPDFAERLGRAIQAGEADRGILVCGSGVGASVIGPEPAFECAVAFLAATFSGEPRHRRRLDKVLAIEAADD
jgi:ribose 5-phosphate isomerase B